MTLLLACHLIATVMMTGLIWFVQVVHYPLFSRVGEDWFVRYEADHTRLTTYVVAPCMFVELITAGLLVFLAPEGIATWLLWTGIALVGVNWFSTAFIQVPCHNKLGAGFDEATWRRLVNTNWIRTFAWSARAVIAVMMVV
ncbi:MAG: hypothetical protein AAF432_01555 [Planctomycetota bacterium]